MNKFAARDFIRLRSVGWKWRRVERRWELAYAGEVITAKNTDEAYLRTPILLRAQWNPSPSKES